MFYWDTERKLSSKKSKNLQAVLWISQPARCCVPLLTSNWGIWSSPDWCRKWAGVYLGNLRYTDLRNILEIHNSKKLSLLESLWLQFLIYSGTITPMLAKVLMTRHYHYMFPHVVSTKLCHKLTIWKSNVLNYLAIYVIQLYKCPGLGEKLVWLFFDGHF